MNKADNDRRLFGGYATVEVVDKQGELVDIGAFKKSFSAFMEMGGNIIDMHTNKKIARVIGHDFTKKDGKDALWLDMECYKLYPYHDDVWEKIQNGEYKGLSMGGRRKKGEFKLKCDDNGCHNHVKGIELFEVSVVDNPANPEATIERVSMAKGDKPLTFSMICPSGNAEPCPDCTVVNKSVGDILKPAAFDRCVAALEDDPDIESPHAVCTAAMKEGKYNGNPSSEEDTIKTGGTQMTEAEKKAAEAKAAGTPPVEEKKAEETGEDETQKNPMEEMMQRIAALEQAISSIMEEKNKKQEETDEKPEDKPEDEDDKNKGDAPLTAKDMESLKTSIDEVKKQLTALKAPAPAEDTQRPNMAKTGTEVDADQALDIKKAAEEMSYEEVAENFPS